MPLSVPDAPMIATRDLCLTLTSLAGPVPILRDVAIDVTAGETVALTGPSGSGKTSLMMVIAGLEAATSGHIAVGGVDYAGLDEDGLARFRRDHVGIVFQNFHLIPTMTALENVATPLELAGEKGAFSRAAAMLSDVGLGQRVRHYPGELSGGEQQRVALARAFAPRPSLLLADEPTGNLDLDTGGRIVDLMFRLAEEAGTTLLLITHDPVIAGRCSRRIALLDGQVQPAAAPAAA